MFRNYFKTAWRAMLKSKAYTSINILGLSTGIAVALIIGLWVYNEFSYDRFLPGYKQVYRVRRNFDSNGDTLTFSTVSLRLAEALRESVPEIEYVVESNWMGPGGLKVGDKKLFLRGAISGSDFLKVFQFPLVKGSAFKSLSDPFSIILTESTARSLFGDQDPMNQTVRYNNEHDLKVTGILKDIPANSTIQINYLIPFSYLDQTNPRIKESRTGSFQGNSFQMFVKLKDGVDEKQVAPKIRNIQHTEKAAMNAMKSVVILQPMENWHLYSEYKNGKVVGGYIEYVRLFSIIGILVLLIACINFINLTTARSEKRAREVGVRKAIGSERKHLIFQFLAESFLVTLIAFIFSILIVSIVLPDFNSLTGTSVFIPWSNPYFWMAILSGVVITSLIAGSRPAFYLSSFNPVKVLKGTFKAGRSASVPRKILVTIQFSCSIALIISTIIIYKQIQYAKNRPTGYDVSQVLVTNSSVDLDKNYHALKNELISKGVVSDMTVSSSPPTAIYWHSNLNDWPGKNPGETIELGVVLTGEDYFKTLGMTMKEGRGFKNEFDTLSAIFNETAISTLRLKDPVGKIVDFQGTKVEVVGVAKDALMISPYAAADPTIFFTGPNTDFGNIIYRLNPAMSTQDALTQATAIFNKHNPAFPFDYQFADQAYADKFKLEVLISNLSAIFAALAIFISCLGLFGLAAYIAEQRTKEIGIRKVLGASIGEVWLLLSREFILLVLLSCLIASPIAYYFLDNWLADYSYRITIGISVFIIAAIMALLITLVTISFQAIKAALADPVKSLKSE